jgi:hypothetical protein
MIVVPGAREIEEERLRNGKKEITQQTEHKKERDRGS